ncbi:MAG: hypothetical protein H7836_15605 [Magnetococcus sp. YQC-3]
MTKARFIGESTFWGMLQNFRVVWIRGRYGGGKTSLAFLIASKLIAEKTVDGLVSNIPATFSSSVEFLRRPCVILLDEAWMYVEGRGDVYDYAGFVRKFDHILLLPSVFSVHARLATFTVQRVFNAYSLGIPIWWYRWNLKDKDVKEHGYFGIQNPKAIFGHYPTKWVAGTDGGISDELAKISKEAGFVGTRRQQKRVMVSFDDDAVSSSSAGVDTDEIQSVADEIEDGAREFSDGVDDMEKIKKDIQSAVSRIRRL